MNPEWENGSENIFRDLGFSGTEAEHLMIRSRLMFEADRSVGMSGLSQREAAKKLGIIQTQMKNLLQGKVQKFRIDALIKMLLEAGIYVEVRVS